MNNVGAKFSDNAKIRTDKIKAAKTGAEHEELLSISW